MEDFERAQDQARVAMRVRRHLHYATPDDFSIETGQSVMDLWQTATRGIYVVTIVVTAMPSSASSTASASESAIRPALLAL